MTSPHDPPGREIAIQPDRPSTGSQPAATSANLASLASRVAARLSDAAHAVSTPALSPGNMDVGTWNQAVSMLAAGTPANTQRSYASAAQYLAAWYRLRFGTDIALPVPPAATVRFVLDHLPSRTPQGDFIPPALPSDIDQALLASGCKSKSGPLAVATVNHRLSYLSRLHKAARLPSPTDHPEVKALLRAARAIAARSPGSAQKKAPAILREHMLAMLALCDHTLTGKRDRALLLFGWATGGRRRSEIAGADMRNLMRSGLEAFDYVLAFSKTNQLGEVSPSDHKPLRGSAAQAMSSWLAASGIEHGPIFRRITSDGSLGAPLTEQAVSRIVTNLAIKAGLEGNFTAHSLRSGFVTQAHLDGIPAPEGMAMSGHASISVYNAYYRPDASRNPRSANLIDPPPVEQRRIPPRT